LYTFTLKSAQQQHLVMYFQRIFSVVLFIISILCAASAMKNVKDQPSVRLMNAVHGEVLMPVAGLGTFGYGRPDGSHGEYWGNEQGYNSTLAWLKAGGRRLDGSQGYASSDGVGAGWVASGVPRSEIFITSKVSISDYDQALEAFDNILKSLQTNYIDLLLIHWPGEASGRPGPSCKQGQPTWAECRIQTWRALETIFKQERVRCLPHF
jgi:diketogulonate reductase-like aldo/keto reductase